MRKVIGLVLLSLTFFGRASEQTPPLRAALYVDTGCRGNGVVYWAEMLHASPDVDLQLVSGEDIRNGALDGRELLVMPGGHGGPQYAAMGDAGADRLRTFVANGGAYFGTCCGIAIALNEEPDFGKRLKMLPLQRVIAPNRGGVTATVTFNRRGAEWLGIREGDWKINYHNGPVLRPADPVPLCTEMEVLATLNCELAQKGAVVGSMYGTPAAVRATYGKGQMFALNCHPEMMPNTREIVVAGIRALTGRTIRLVEKKATPGAPRVGVRSDGYVSSKAALTEYLRMYDDPSVDVVPVTKTQLDEGIGRLLDRIVTPLEETNAVRSADIPLAGPFPLLCTPYAADGSLDTDVLAKEARFVADCGANGVIWPAADDALKLLTADEERAGLEAIAAALDGRAAWFCPCCPGTNTADALRRVMVAEEIASRHPQLKTTMLVRLADDATDDAAHVAHYEAVARVARHPVIIQTYNGRSPLPSMPPLIDLARRHPQTFGWFKVEGSDKVISDLMAELVAAKDAVKTVFTGWGGRDWLYQYRRVGTRGVISQRPMYADLMVRAWQAFECGSPEADGLFAKFMYLRNLDNVLPSENMRGWNLYVLKRRGVFVNTLSRVPGKNGGWELRDLRLTAPQIAEIEARLRYCGLVK